MTPCAESPLHPTSAFCASSASQTASSGVGIFISNTTGVQQHGSEVTPAPLTGTIEAPSTSRNGASTPVPAQSQPSETAENSQVITNTPMPLTQGEAGHV
ncbi:hypothetical protein TNIN_285051 [Trichonephila inaurata madagascariensis]|uniref:Uncharacterized protein n=1 Tax=Trichonephila inaurata madagascariensis TaxID=2747483 RepID=A0A8X6XAE1_9ARAC|nr:hypothetical protein TNIN_285051 [Trichonephila inaurata madagascariensis]